jgi:hypothetical protein
LGFVVGKAATQMLIGLSGDGLLSITTQTFRVHLEATVIKGRAGKDLIT